MKSRLDDLLRRLVGWGVLAEAQTSAAHAHLQVMRPATAPGADEANEPWARSFASSGFSGTSEAILWEILIQGGFFTEQALYTALSTGLGTPLLFDLKNVQVDPAVARLVPEAWCRGYHLLLLRRVAGNHVQMAIADPYDLIAIDDVQLRTDLTCLPLIVPLRKIDEKIKEVFAGEVPAPASRASADSRTIAAFSLPFPATESEPEKAAESQEGDLLQEIEEKGRSYFEALWSLARFYSQTGRQEKSLSLINQILHCSDDRETQARMILGLGQLNEQLSQWEAAISHYSTGIELGAEADRNTWYFLHNNLGYCLNTLGKFSEGEAWLRRAIEIDEGKPNAFKNLGIALEGQGRFEAAARAYVRASRANIADGRALRLLINMVEGHPELYSQIPDLAAIMAELREAGELLLGLQDGNITGPH